MPLHVYEDLEQGSDEWLAARAGIVTASTIGKLITPTLKVASNDTSRGLITTLAAERITGHVEPVYVNADMQRGHDEEPLARDLYARHNKVRVEEVGFMVREDNGIKLGFSPDGLVNTDGLIEVKSRRQKKQVTTILSGEIPPENRAQCQAGLFVSGREWLDFISYSSGMHVWTTRVYPRVKWFEVIARAVATAEEEISSIVDNYTHLTEGLPVADVTPSLDDITI